MGVDQEDCKEEANTKTCIYQREGADFAVRLQTTKTKTEQRLHNVTVLKVETGYDPDSSDKDNYIEIASFEFRAPEAEMIGFDDQRQPERIFLKLKHGLGWYEVNLQRERLLKSACDEREALDPDPDKVQHFESFESFVRRNKDWLSEEFSDPCSLGDTVEG